MSWNYRICTRLSGTREFKICEIYYNEDGTPRAYSELHNILTWSDKSDLIETIKLLQSVPANEVYDLDNWPSLYENKTKIKGKNNTSNRKTSTRKKIQK